MFNSKNIYPENKHCYRIVKLENISKEDSEVSLWSFKDADLCGVKFQPTNLYEISKEEFEEHLRRKRRLRRRNRIERCGHTSSSSFLAGLQTFIDSCGLLERHDFKSKNKSNRVLFESSPHTTLSTGYDAFSGECSKSQDCRQTSVRFCEPYLNNSYPIYTINSISKEPQFLAFNVKTKTKKRKKNKSEISLGESTEPEERNLDKIDEIPELSDDHTHNSKIKFRSESSAIMLTDNGTQVSCAGPCIEQTIIPRDASSSWKYSSQSSIIQSAGKHSHSNSKEHHPASCARIDNEDGKKVCIKFKPGVSLTSTTFPPFEISPCSDICDSHEKLRHSHKKSHRKPLIFPDSSSHDPMMLINGNCSSCFKSKLTEMKKTKSNDIPIVQPVVGYCNMGKHKSYTLKCIKYALVKISEFVGYTTYEVMTPYRNPPKDIPTCVAELFVISREKKPVSVSNKAIVKKYDDGTETVKIHHQSF